MASDIFSKWTPSFVQESLESYSCAVDDFEGAMIVDLKEDLISILHEKMAAYEARREAHNELMLGSPSEMDVFLSGSKAFSAGKRALRIRALIRFVEAGGLTAAQPEGALK